MSPWVLLMALKRANWSAALKNSPCFVELSNPRDFLTWVFCSSFPGDRNLNDLFGGLFFDVGERTAKNFLLVPSQSRPSKFFASFSRSAVCCSLRP